MHDALSAFDYHTITSLMQTYLLVAAARSIFWQIRYIFSESQQVCVALSFRIAAGKTLCSHSAITGKEEEHNSSFFFYAPATNCSH